MRHELAPPREVVRIAERLEAAGYETWCVGGAVRDALLGHPSLDWDLATAAPPAEVQRVFRRVVPVGVEHGTVGVLDANGILHEVTTFRRDVRTDGRHAVVEFGVSLDDDLARRDFTINAIAWHPTRHELRDPFGGQDDLQAGRLRAVGDPAARMREDRLRALRAIRFASRFGFAIAPETWTAVQDSAPDLGRLSAERVRQELEKTMEQVALPSVALRRWREAGALRALLPALDNAPVAALYAADALARPGLRGRPARRINRLAALVALLGRAGALEVTKALKMSNADGQWIGALAGGFAAHGDALFRAASDGEIPDRLLRRVAADVGRTKVLPLLRVCGGVWNGVALAAGDRAPPALLVSTHRRLYARAAHIAWRDPIELADLAVDGEDLRRVGVPPGPALGRTLRLLLDAVVEDPARNTREALLALAAAEPR
ncbi:MAG: CCA tRNA nucleotidyltransferase [Gemmatimonadaceae bacterium]|nr:CCA tRNA nucleotidyltransferase [Gemmatimonadaceae bacterium]